MKYISLFAGIGGFDLALNRLGHECVYVNEWDKYAAQTYEKNFKHKPDTRNITTVSAEEIPEHDLLVGGFPCQSFSIAGKRKGFTETRGTLFFEICRIVHAKRTSYLLLENVSGLLSHDNGKTFTTIITTLDELGYDCQWQVLNSKYFGVPQNRERIFIIGNLRGKRRPKVFPITYKAETNIRGNFIDLQLEGAKITKQSRTIQSRYYKGYSNRYGENSGVLQLLKNGNQGQRLYHPNGIATTISSNGGGLGAKTGLYAVHLKFLDRNQKNYQGEYSFTVDTVNTGGIMQDMKIRRLTPIECERLQGFPDNWTEGVSNTQRYKQLGNAVTVNVVYEIMKRF